MIFISEILSVGKKVQTCLRYDHHSKLPKLNLSFFSRVQKRRRGEQVKNVQNQGGEDDCRGLVMREGAVVGRELERERKWRESEVIIGGAGGKGVHAPRPTTNGERLVLLLNQQSPHHVNVQVSLLPGMPIKNLHPNQLCQRAKFRRPDCYKVGK